MDRREFIKKCLSVALISSVSPLLKGKPLFGSPLDSKQAKIPDIVAIKNGEPDKMFDIGIKTLGGIGNFVMITWRQTSLILCFWISIPLKNRYQTRIEIAYA